MRLNPHLARLRALSGRTAETGRPNTERLTRSSRPADAPTAAPAHAPRSPWEVWDLSPICVADEEANLGLAAPPPASTDRYVETLRAPAASGLLVSQQVSQQTVVQSPRSAREVSVASRLAHARQQRQDQRSTQRASGPSFGGGGTPCVFCGKAVFQAERRQTGPNKVTPSTLACLFVQSFTQLCCITLPLTCTCCV